MRGTRSRSAQHIRIARYIHVNHRNLDLSQLNNRIHGVLNEYHYVEHHLLDDDNGWLVVQHFFDESPIGAFALRC